ncbi:MAG TPA: hypothetical protein VFO60_03835 [Candidatus Dormibacteraeota bacterium]|nr:hypothetical protein [Candidatus Dormibacteraeota bacterium]
MILEVGTSRTFAAAVDWPGWCRSGRSPEEAIATLAAYAARYAQVAARTAHPLPPGAAGDLEVVETVRGDRTTDFGAPSTIASADGEPADAGAARRLTELLGAAWEELERVVATAPELLRKGPRGGGRDRDAVDAHVVDAERSYARRLGVALTAAEWKDGHAALMRARIRAALLAGGGSAEPRAWPLRYVVRRMAWHVLDHAWEIEDRSDPGAG